MANAPFLIQRHERVGAEKAIDPRERESVARGGLNEPVEYLV